MIISEITMDNGMFRFGFLASSPVVAMQSKPTNPKKHLAAPAITPEKPNGRKPPSPACFTSLGIELFEMLQFFISAKKNKQSCLCIDNNVEQFVKNDI